MKNLSVLLALIFYPLLSASTELVNKMVALSDLVGEVQVGKKIVRQEVSFDNEAPFRVQLHITEVDSKGKETIIESRINLALFDPNLIGWEDGKDRLQVNMRSGKEPIVKEFKNGELSGYRKEAVIYAANIDNAREIERLLKEIIPLALRAWETSRAIPETYDDLKTWMQAHVKDIVVADDLYEQQWDFDMKHSSRCALTQTLKKGSHKTSRTYHWNLADIYLPSVEVDIKSKEVMVHLGIKQKGNYIRVEEGGLLKTYENEVLVYLGEVDEAHAMAYALQKLVPLAENVQKEYLPRMDNKEMAIDSFRTSLINLRQGEDDLRQKIEGGCEAVYHLSRENSKSKINYVYEFNYSDFLASTIEVNVKGTKIGIKMMTIGGEKYVYLKENGEQQNYSNFIAFPAPDIPSARVMEHYLLQIIEGCSSTTSPGEFQDLQKVTSDIEFSIEQLEQTLVLIDDNPCKFSILIKETDIKKVKEEQYDFNLNDLDQDRIEISVKAKTVSLFVPTKGNEQIIKNYTDAEKIGYVKDFSITLRDIPSAKVAHSTLNALIDSCATK